MAANGKSPAIVWARLVLGFLLFVGMIAVHVLVQPLPLPLYGVPGAMVAPDLAALWGRK